MKASKSKTPGQKKSAVISPGTGSGFGVKSGKTMTPVSAPVDKQGLSRKPAGALK